MTFYLEDELKKGIQCYDLPSLFPGTYAAEQYREQKLDTAERIQQIEELTADVDPEILDAYVGQ